MDMRMTLKDALYVSCAIITITIITIGFYNMTHTVKYLHHCGYSKEYVMNNAIDTHNINQFPSYGIHY